MDTIDSDGATNDSDGATDVDTTPAVETSTDVDGSADVDTETATSAPATRSGDLRFLWWNVLALVVLLLVLVTVLHRHEAIAHPDEGVYSAAAKALDAGSWSVERPAPDVDVLGIGSPLIDSEVRGDRMYPYTRHAAYPLVLLPAYRLGGTLGLLFVSALAMAGTATAAAFLARRIDPRYGPWTLWLVAVASPLFFDGLVVTGQSLGACAAALMALGVTRAVDDGRVRHLAYAVPAAIAAILFRSEGVIVVLATGAVLVAMALRPRARKIVVRDAAIGAGIGVVAVATYVLDTRIADAISGVPGYGTNPSTIILGDRTGPINALWATLLRPFEARWAEALPLVPLVAILVLVTVLACRFLPKAPIVAGAAAVAAALAAVLAIFLDRGAPNLVNGLIPAFPLLLALVLLGTGTLASPFARRTLAVTLLASVMLVLTIYEGGGGSEWGGRFFHVLLPPLGVLIVCCLDRVRQLLDDVPARVVLVALVVVSLAWSTQIIRWNDTFRGSYHHIVETSVTEARAKSVEPVPLVIIVQVGRNGSPRAFWDAGGRADVVLAQNPRALTILMAAAVERRRQVFILTDVPPRILRDMLGDRLEEPGWTIRGAVPMFAPAIDMALVELGPEVSD